MVAVDNSFRLSATDLSNHLSCQHLTQLNRKVALGDLKKPHWKDPSLEVLEQRGREHEAAYVEFLSRKGLNVLNIAGQPVASTIDAMKQGVDVIVQGRLEMGLWVGYTDILIKVPGKSKFGNWSYEVQDTKLAQNTRAATILQLCLYSELLTLLQGTAPEKFYVIKPGENFQTDSYRFADFQAYYRLTKKNFEQVMAGSELPTYPEPVDHCSICRWWRVCDTRRHADDHLSLVAGIRSMHIEELKTQHVNTLEQFANLNKIEKPKRGNKETFEKKQLQAKIQLKGRIEKQLKYEALPIEPGRGLNRLPEPGAGDIYFDIEGDAFYEDGGLEYILGYAFQNAKKELVYKNHWSTNRLEEKKAFEEFMGIVVGRWKKFPKMYIYHFAPYEPSAVKRLARVHAVYEKEVDDLLRAERFIDLHAVFKEALLASVEVYSLKELEKFTKYTRVVELHDASVARKSVEVALELNDFKSLPKEAISITEKYNEDDCLATEALHRWLEELRASLILNSGKEFVRPAENPDSESEDKLHRDARAIAIYDSLIKGLPEDKTTWTQEHKAKWLLAHQVDYFRREDNSYWWEYHHIHKLDHESLAAERKAITGLEFVEILPLKGKLPSHRYKFPEQDIEIREKAKLVEVMGDKYAIIGEVEGLSLVSNTIDIKKTGKTIDLHPIAVHVKDKVITADLADSLMSLAESIDEFGLEHKWPNHAAKDLLMKRQPKLVDGEGAFILKGESIEEAAIRIVSSLDKSVLAVQGPPGSGKTYIGAKMIIALALKGKRIGVTAVSHKVIRNLFDEVIAKAKELNVTIHLVHKPPVDKGAFKFDDVQEAKSADDALLSLDKGKVVGGTAFLWSSGKSQGKLDYLFVDEAGQMSLSQVLAASRATSNLILLGDPQQLEQPQKGAHPEGSDIAALTYLLDGHATMPEGKGLFLDITRRLHPNVCQFTSELFYEGKLNSLPGLEKQVISGKTPFDGAGLFYVPVEHRGNQNKSIEEIEKVAKLVEQLMKGGKWTNAKGETVPLKKTDILIVAPYNAQVSGLIERLPDMQIGTVDKFQGQEAPVVIYSMTSSSPEDAPRGMSFLYSPNRLNVATSRAKSVCILVGSPKLLEPDCKTIDQMRWANTLCRFRELATR